MPHHAPALNNEPIPLTDTFFALLVGVHRSPGTMILSGERQLTLRHVRTLAAHFGVSADLFIEPAV